MNKRVKSNTIRIIAGQWRGRRLPVLDSQGLRPTTDRVRETLFNWLMHDVVGANCLDLFAGSGALGLECLSRGAKAVQFVESDKGVAKALKANILTLGANDSASVLEQSAMGFLAGSAKTKFNLVFLDPPFQAGLLAPAIKLLHTNNWLGEGAMVYIERSANDPALVIPSKWQIYRERTMGQSHFCLYTV